MALMMLLSLFFGLLHQLLGVCVGEVLGDDPIDLQTRIYTNRYPIANWTDNRVIIALAGKGQCMSYIGLDETPLESLAACELHCSAGYYNTWDCIAPDIESFPDWNNTFTDEQLFQWSPGNCSCSNSSSPTPSVEGYDDYSTASSPEKPAVKVAYRHVQDLVSYYGYRVEPDNDAAMLPQPHWNYWRIVYVNAHSVRANVGVFAVMNNNVNNRVLRISEIFARRDERASGVRANFHDYVISFWRLTPLFRHLDYLTELRFDTIIEESISNIIQEVYQTMGVDQSSPLRVFRGGQQLNENHVFNMILRRSRFARRMQQAIDEYIEFSHRRIEGFYFTVGMPGCDFAIYFDGYDPSTIGDATWDWDLS